MTKTNPTYKSSSVTPPKANEEQKPKAQTAEKAQDAYKAASPDAYKGLLSGSYKAESLEGGCLNEMREYEDGTKSYRYTPTYDQHIQNLISSRMLGPTRKYPARDTLGNIPRVPNLQKDILSLTKIEDGNTPYVDLMENVVDRYSALEKVLVTMYNNLLIALDSRNSWRMTAGEIREMISYKDKLGEALNYCRVQYEQATSILRDQKKLERELNSSDDPFLVIDPDLEA